MTIKKYLICGCTCQLAEISGESMQRMLYNVSREQRKSSKKEGGNNTTRNANAMQPEKTQTS